MHCVRNARNEEDLATERDVCDEPIMSDDIRCTRATALRAHSARSLRAGWGGEKCEPLRVSRLTMSTVWNLHPKTSTVHSW